MALLRIQEQERELSPPPARRNAASPSAPRRDTASAPSAQRRGTGRSATPEPADGALVRFDTAIDGWVAAIPPVPGGFEVSVAFSDADGARRDGPVLEGLGYRVVAGVVATHTAEVADFLVPQALLERHPRWWRTLAGRADQAFSLAHGPAARLLADALRPHFDAPA